MKKSIAQKLTEESKKSLITVSGNFKFLRQANDLSIERLSEISGIDAKILTDIEDGQDFDVRYLIRLCDIYHVKSHKILFCPLFS